MKLNVRTGLGLQARTGVNITAVLYGAEGPTDNITLNVNDTLLEKFDKLVVFNTSMDPDTFDCMVVYVHPQIFYYWQLWNFTDVWCPEQITMSALNESDGSYLTRTFAYDNWLEPGSHSRWTQGTGSCDEIKDCRQVLVNGPCTRNTYYRIYCPWRCYHCPDMPEVPVIFELDLNHTETNTNLTPETVRKTLGNFTASMPTTRKKKETEVVTPSRQLGKASTTIPIVVGSIVAGYFLTWIILRLSAVSVDRPNKAGMSASEMPSDAVPGERSPCACLEIESVDDVLPQQDEPENEAIDDTDSVGDLGENELICQEDLTSGSVQEAAIEATRHLFQEEVTIEFTADTCLETLVKDVADDISSREATTSFTNENCLENVDDEVPDDIHQGKTEADFAGGISSEQDEINVAEDSCQEHTETGEDILLEEDVKEVSDDICPDSDAADVADDSEKEDLRVDSCPKTSPSTSSDEDAYAYLSIVTDGMVTP